MNLCYRQVSYQNPSFTLNPSHLGQTMKYRGVSYQAPLSTAQQDCSITVLKYRGFSYIKKYIIFN